MTHIATNIGIEGYICTFVAKANLSRHIGGPNYYIMQRPTPFLLVARRLIMNGEDRTWTLSNR
jgi:hypothetical protein